MQLILKSLVERGLSGDVQEVWVFNPIHNWTPWSQLALPVSAKGPKVTWNWPIRGAEEILNTAVCVNMAWMTTRPGKGSNRRDAKLDFSADSVLGKLLVGLRLPGAIMQDSWLPNKKKANANKNTHTCLESVTTTNT